MKWETTARINSHTTTYLGWAVFAAGIGVIAVAGIFICRCYMPCPYWDEWDIIKEIANGNRVWSPAWLWAQHNEHRIPVLRVLISLDVFAFGARNISLLVEMFVIQLLHWSVICYFVERYSELPAGLKRTIEGLFAFCLFHPKQENLWQPFQLSFILPFALATAALVLVAFADCLKRPFVWLALAGLMPFCAALNLAGGLLIGPVLTLLAIARKLPKKFIFLITAIWLPGIPAYFWQYHSSGMYLSADGMLSRAGDVGRYILIYFGARWLRLGRYEYGPEAIISLVCVLLLLVQALRDRDKTSRLQWFLLSECVLAILTALLTAAGRLQFGVEQAYSPRYQTVVMLYWASLFSLILTRIWQWNPSRLKVAQWTLAGVLVLSILGFRGILRMRIADSDTIRNACEDLVADRYHPHGRARLYPSQDSLEPAASFLRQRWSAQKH